MELFGSSGFVFVSDQVFKHQGAYTITPQRPDACDKCAGGSLHAHGRYKRSLRTLKNRVLHRVKVWRHRWLCLCCGRTMSNGTPDVIGHVPNCTLVTATVLWAYFLSGNGIVKGSGEPVDDAAAPRTLARYLKRAKAVGTTTQQAIREVLIQLSEPRPWDEGFAYGLPPPWHLIHRHRNAHKTAILYQTLAMLHMGAKKLRITACLLMARAKIRTGVTRTRFLL